jgi:predicted transcriptional regulator
MAQQLQKRGFYQIIENILEICIQRTGEPQVIEKANLSYTVWNRYKDFLVRERFIKVKDKTVVTTDKGLAYLKNFRDTIEFLFK